MIQLSSPILIHTLLQMLPQNLDPAFEWAIGFFSVLFLYLKYILSFILIILGILILFRFKKQYSKYGFNTYQNDMEEKNVLRISHIVLGVLYIFFGIGILANYMIHFLIWALDPIPDRYIFIYINNFGPASYWDLSGIIDVSQFSSIEMTIFYFISLGSFVAILEVLVSVWLIVSYNRIYIKKAIINLIIGCCFGILTGFTTCLPLLL